MEFLGIGPLELFFIVLIALILLGPQDMVKAGRTIGRLLRKTILSPSWLNVQRKVRNLPYELMREAGLEDEELRAGFNDLRNMTRVDLGQEMARSLQQQNIPNQAGNNNANPVDLPEPPQIPTPVEPAEDGLENPVRSYPLQEEPASEPIIGDVASGEDMSNDSGSDPTQP